MEGKRKKFLIGCAVLLAVGIIWAFTGTGFRSGAVIMRIESGGLKSWSLSFDRASDGFINTHTLRVNEGEDLRADVSFENGELLLTIKQKQTEISVPFVPGESSAVISLEDFEKGRLQLKLVSYGAEEVKSKFELIERE